MKILITYGKNQEELEIRSDSSAVISLTDSYRAAADSAVIDNAAKNPVDSPDLKTFLQNCRELLIIVNDGARATPTASVLKYIHPFLKQISVRFIVACGAHKQTTETELQKIFGDLYKPFRKQIQIHDAKRSPMVDMGPTSRGTQVKFNRVISEVDKIININSIEPHYFAGFTGGRKSFQPGIASYKTIEQNHALAMEPGSQLLKLQGNPVHEDMMEAVSMIDKEIFSINLILNSKNMITSASAGNWRSAFYKAVAEAENSFLKTCSFSADIIVAVVRPPLDEDLYQAQKGIENCRNVLKKGGIMILTAACPGGIGKNEFFTLLSSCKTPEEVFVRIRNSYKLGYHKAAKLADFLAEYQLWMVTDIPAEQLEKISVRKFNSVTAALQEAVKQKGSEAKVLINQDAGIFVPVN